MNKALLESADAFSPVVRKFRAYPSYRSSKVWGVPVVPEHWQEQPLKRVVNINTDKLPETTDSDYEIEYVDIGNVSLESGITSTEQFRFENAPSRARRKVSHGDVIVSTVRTYLKAVAQVVNPPKNLIVSTGFAVLSAKPAIHPGFLYRLAQSEPFVERIMAYSVGVSYPAINASDIGRFPVPLPPLDEQRAIAAFLDRETARIDELIAKKQRLIELLKEKRQAVISRAVTKGLDPTAPMKPSSIDWLGEIPAHWGIQPLKYQSAKIGSGKTPRGGAEVYVSTGVVLLRSQNIHDEGMRLEDLVFIDDETDQEMANSRVKPGDVLLNITGASIGRCSIAPDNLPKANVNQHVCIIRPRKIKTEFLHAILCSKEIKDWIQSHENGTSREGLNFRQVGNVRIPIPPEAEQNEIVSRLQKRTSQLDKLMKSVDEAIDKLRDYRSALITAAVTGQIDVRQLGKEAP